MTDVPPMPSLLRPAAGGSVESTYLRSSHRPIRRSTSTSTSTDTNTCTCTCTNTSTVLQPSLQTVYNYIQRSSISRASSLSTGPPAAVNTPHFHPLVFGRKVFQQPSHLIPPESPKNIELTPIPTLGVHAVTLHFHHSGFRITRTGNSMTDKQPRGRWGLREAIVLAIGVREDDKMNTSLKQRIFLY